MIEFKAQLNHQRISARKMRLVADMIRTMSVPKAIDQLELTDKKAAGSILKTLKSAIANARNKKDLKPDQLYIKKITVDQAMSLKRFKPAAMGSAHPFVKHGAHLMIILSMTDAAAKVDIEKQVKAKTKSKKSDKEKSVDKMDNKVKIGVSKKDSQPKAGVVKKESPKVFKSAVRAKSINKTTNK